MNKDDKIIFYKKVRTLKRDSPIYIQSSEYNFKISTRDYDVRTFNRSLSNHHSYQFKYTNNKCYLNDFNIYHYERNLCCSQYG